MSAFALKIRHLFSDIFLDIELFFGKFKKEKKEIPKKIEYKVEEKAEEEVVKKVTKKEVKTVKATKKDNAEKAKLPIALRILRLSGKERLSFYDQMSTLVGSDVTLIDSLYILQAQSKKKGVKKLYAEMIHHINAGLGLAETMKLFPHIFPAMQSALVEAGEESGNLKTVLAQIVDELENHQEFMRKIKGAMFYPVILIVLALIMVSGMMIFVIPKVAKMYEQSNTSLPLLTQKVIDLSNLLSAYYPIILGSILGGVILLLLLINKTRFGKLMWEKFVSLIPVFGNIAKEKNIMAFASNLGLLLQSGVLISEAFEITEKTVDNLHYQKEISKIHHGIVMGQSVSELMGLEDIKQQKFKENKLFPLQVAQLIHIGELTGSISNMLIKIRDNFKKSIDYKLKNISTMIEPLMIFVVAVLVGSILLAVMLPFFYIGTTIS